jgi:lipoate-protein ligase B
MKCLDCLEIRDLGLVNYTEAYQLQRQIVADVIAGAPDQLLLCEHRTVLTLGRLGTDKNILFSDEQLKDKGVEVIRTDRGGEVTLHSPGQLVVYPILNLNKYGRDLKGYLHKLEEVAIAILRDFGILAKRNPGERGVWVGKDKIVSIGIGVKKWISYHGVGINVNTDLELFRMIKPCGLDTNMTSVQKLMGKTIPLGDIKQRFVEHFEKEFKIDQRS